MNEQWGVVGIPRTNGGIMLVLPGLAENGGKRERVVGYQTSLEPVVGNEFPGGAVEVGDRADGHDTLILALLREVAQEAGIICSPSQLEKLPRVLKVEQWRDERLKTFLVASYLINLSDEQEDWLRRNGASEHIDNEEVRPRDQVLGNQVMEMATPLFFTRIEEYA